MVGDDESHRDGEPPFFKEGLSNRIVAQGKDMPIELLLLGKLIRSIARAGQEGGVTAGEMVVWTIIHEEYRFWSRDELEEISGLRAEAMDRVLNLMEREGVAERTDEGVRPLASGHERRVAIASEYLRRLDEELQRNLQIEASLYERVGPQLRPMELLAALLLARDDPDRMHRLVSLIAARELMSDTIG